MSSVLFFTLNIARLQANATRRQASATPSLSTPPVLSTATGRASLRMTATSTPQVLETPTVSLPTPTPVPTSLADQPTATTAAQMQPTPTPQPTPAPQPTPTPTPTQPPVQNQPAPSGNLVLNDPLVDNSHGYGWEEDAIAHQRCGFAAGGYQTHAEAYDFSAGGTYCLSQNTSFDNFRFEMHVKITDGTRYQTGDGQQMARCGGIVFRVRTNQNMVAIGGYFFVVCENGYYFLALAYDPAQSNFSTTADGSPSHLSTYGFSAAVHQGLNQSNLLSVVANQTHLDLAINGQTVISFSDTLFGSGNLSGQIGCGSSFYMNTLDTVCSDAKVWKL